MNLRNNINASLMGLIGSIILIISEFFPWFSAYSLIELYVITVSVQIENAFLYLFPLISGIICLIANSLIIFNFELRIKSIIISLIGSGFLLIFFFDYISQEINFITNAGAGLYLGIAGFLLILFNIIIVLMTKEKNLEGN